MRFTSCSKGQVEVFSTDAQGNRVDLAVLKSGDYFGEIGLLLNARRNATGAGFARIAGEDCENDGRKFPPCRRRIRHGEQRDRAGGAETCRARFVANAGSGEAEADLRRRLREFDRETFSAGDVIVREGDLPERFYLVIAGSVVVSQRDGNGSDHPLATLRAGNYFGETGLIHNAPRNATVTASGDEPVVVYSCDPAAFDRLVREAGGPSGDLAMALIGRLSVDVR
jgi:CRP-like cAMP-binding protein